VLRRHASDARGSRLPSGGSGRQVIGLSCRWLDGTVRQQCVGHLPFERRATVNGGFSILSTGSIDPEPSDDVCNVEVGSLLFTLPVSASC